MTEISLTSEHCILRTEGNGTLVVVFYDNEENPTDSENISCGAIYESYCYKTYSIGIFRNEVKKYGFSIKNNGYSKVTVINDEKIFDLTNDNHNTGFDFWNMKIFNPKNTNASYTQYTGGINLINSDIK